MDDKPKDSQSIQSLVIHADSGLAPTTVGMSLLYGYDL